MWRFNLKNYKTNLNNFFRIVLKKLKYRSIIVKLKR